MFRVLLNHLPGASERTLLRTASGASRLLITTDPPGRPPRCANFHKRTAGPRVPIGEFAKDLVSIIVIIPSNLPPLVLCPFIQCCTSGSPELFFTNTLFLFS
jgi:hypothetical protein